MPNTPEERGALPLGYRGHRASAIAVGPLDDVDIGNRE